MTAVVTPIGKLYLLTQRERDELMELVEWADFESDNGDFINSAAAALVRNAKDVLSE